MRRIVRLLRNDSGTVPIEYGLIAALVTIALIASVGGYANGFQNTYNRLAATISP